MSIKQQSTPQTDYLIVNNKQIPVYIQIAHRRRASVSIRQRITIRIPKAMNRHQRLRTINTFKDWAKMTLTKKPYLMHAFKPVEYHNDKRLILLGKPMCLQIIRGNRLRNTGMIQDNLIQLRCAESATQGKIRHCLINLLKRHYQPYLQKQIERINRRHFHRPLENITFRDNRSTWGSCSPHGDISIAVRLLLTPPEIFEYVCLHECAHWVHPNHSKNFWLLVESIDPDYRSKVSWLRTQGVGCQL